MLPGATVREACFSQRRVFAQTFTNETFDNSD